MVEVCFLTDADKSDPENLLVVVYATVEGKIFKATALRDPTDGEYDALKRATAGVIENIQKGECE